MRYTQHSSNNGVLGAPPGVVHDACGALPVTHVQYADGTRAVMSFWQPNAEELAALASGSPVFMTIWGTTHAPVALGVAGVKYD